MKEFKEFIENKEAEKQKISEKKTRFEKFLDDRNLLTTPVEEELIIEEKVVGEKGEKGDQGETGQRGLRGKKR